jgi:hypothetical protein
MLFGIEITGWVLFWIILGSLVGVLIEMVLFKAACALGDVNDPSWLITFLVVLPFFVLRAFAAYGFYLLLKPYVEGIALYLATIAASGLAFWILCSVIYTLVLSVPMKKGFFTAGAQALLDSLVGALALGVTLFVLSIVQIQRGPATPKSDQRPAPSPPVASAPHTVR